MSEENEKIQAQDGDDVQVGKPDKAESTAQAAAPEATNDAQAEGTAEAEAAVTETMDPKEIEEGKVFAILSYVLSLAALPFFIVPLIMRNNGFSLYHAKQCLIIWLLGLVGGVVSSILAAVCIGVILGIALGIFCLVITIMGLINAINGKVQPVPLVGKLGIDWFKGLTKA